MDSLEARVAVLEQRIARLTRRMGAPFGLARTTLSPDDTGSVQTVQAQLDALSTRDAIPMMYHYGYFANPPVDTDVHVAYLDGDRAKGVVIASNHQSHRKSGTESGDAGLYAHGHLFHLTAGGILMTGDVTHTGDVAQTGNFTLTGNLHVSGQVIAGYGAGDQVGLQTHTHTDGTPGPTPGS